MRTLTIALLAITSLVVAVGFFRLWFVLSNPVSEAATGKGTINLSVDSEKARQDTKAIADKASTSSRDTTNEVKPDGQAHDGLKSKDPQQTPNTLRLLERRTE